jgi:vacuolar-type H+-ATPase subunit H
MTSVADAVREKLILAGYDEEQLEVFEYGDELSVRANVDYRPDAAPVIMYASTTDDPEVIVERFTELVHKREDELIEEAEDHARAVHDDVIAMLTEFGHAGDAGVTMGWPKPRAMSPTSVIGFNLLTETRVSARTIPSYATAQASTPLTELPVDALRAIARHAIEVVAEAGAALHAVLAAAAAASGDKAKHLTMEWSGTPEACEIKLGIGDSRARATVDTTWPLDGQLDELTRLA